MVEFTKERSRTPFYKSKKFLWLTCTPIALVAIILFAFRISPWPGALVIRTVFTQDGSKRTKALEKYVPSVAISTLRNQDYRNDDPDAYLDVYFPSSVASTKNKLPLIIWTHGGAWISGSKEDNATYYKLLAAEGFVVVSVDYSVGPGHTYPTAVNQLNDMYGYINRNAARFHIDSDKIFLAGDSAGSQLSSQMAALVTNTQYASAMNIKPQMEASQLKGVILNCGIYNMGGLTQPDPTLPKIVGWGNDVSVWAYTGTRDFSDPVIKQMSAYYHVTKNFPPTYISGGNGDPLTDAQSKPFADKLKSLSVPVTTLFYAANHTPSLPHEYQFNLDNKDGVDAFNATATFVKKILQSQ